MKRLLAILCCFLAANNAKAAHLVCKDAKLDIKTDKVVMIKGDIEAELAFKVLKDIATTSTLPGARLVIINSNGGRVGPGVMIINALHLEKRVYNTKIICIADKDATSMAFNIMSFCDVRLATPKTKSLVHKIRVEFKDKTMHTAKQLRKYADQIDKDDEQFRRQNAKLMGLSLADYDLFADNETYWRAEKLLEKGYYHGLCSIEE